MSDLFDDAALSPELRAELMKISTNMKTLAAQIDALVTRKRKADLDENEEPTFRFGAKVSIPKNFFFTKKMVAYAFKHGFTPDDVKTHGDAFVTFYNKSGRKWQDWSRVWYDWVRREEQRIKDGWGKSPVSSKDLKAW